MAAVFIEGRCQIRSRGADCRDQAKEDSGEKRNAERKEQDVDVECDSRTIFSDARNIARVNAEQKTNAGKSKNETKRSASDRKRKAFCQQLADDLTASRAKSGTRSQLT